MTEATNYTWITPAYPLNLLTVSSTPMNNGTTPTIQGFYLTSVMIVSAGYGQYLEAMDPHWMKIWNTTRNEYMWGRHWMMDYVQMQANIPSTWVAGDRITNSADGIGGSKNVEIWATNIPTDAVAVEVVVAGKDSAPSTSTLAQMRNTDNTAYLVLYVMNSTIKTYLQGMCKITASRFRYSIDASGTDTFDYSIKLLGYYTQVGVIPPTTSRIISPKGVQIA